MGAAFAKDGQQTIKNYKSDGGDCHPESEEECLSPKSLQRASKSSSNKLWNDTVGLPEYPAPDPADVTNSFIMIPCEVPGLALCELRQGDWGVGVGSWEASLHHRS